MTTPASRLTLRIVGDFALGFGLFCLATAALSVTGSPASGVDPASYTSFVSNGGVAVFEPWSRQLWSELFSPTGQDRLTVLAVLGFAVATTTAFNLALIRHLRQAYIAPRRRIVDQR